MPENGLEIRLKSVKRNENEPTVTVSAELCDGENRELKILILFEDDYRRISPKSRQINRETYEELEKAATLCSAYNRGAGLLGFGSNSEKRLAIKLRQRGFDNETAGMAAKRLNDSGVIDEESDACREAELCVKKLWGERRIISKLYEKGYRNAAIATAKEYLSTVDFVGNCARLIIKFAGEFPTDRNAAGKLTAKLQAYGYSFSEIKEAAKQNRRGS